MKIEKNKKKFFISLGIIVFSVLLSFGIIFQSTAQTPNIFGGFVTISKFCECSGNFLLTISSPVGGQFIYQPGTPQFPYGSLPRMGVWTLGIYSPGAVCLVPGKPCEAFGLPIGTITPIVGTSL